MTALDPALAPDALPAPGTDEGWAALEREALRNGFPDAQSYLDAYIAGRINVGAAGYRPGDPHTGFGQIQAYDHAAGESGLDLAHYAAEHTPEALARARGEEPDHHGGHDGGHHDGGHHGGHDGGHHRGHDGGHHGGHDGGHHGGHDGGHDGGHGHHGGGSEHPGPLGGDHPFTPPANFTSYGWPIEYAADGTPQLPVFVVAPTLPEGVDHFDRYTGEPLDAAGHIVPGVPRAGETHQFTTAVDQRIGLGHDGRVDPVEVDRLETEARENGQASVSDQIAATTRPFPGHPLSDTGQYARPVVAPGQAPAVYSGPDGTYILTANGTVLTGPPGSELTYHGKDGSATIDPLGRTVTTDPDGHTTVHEPEPDPEVEFRQDNPGPFDPDRMAGDPDRVVVGPDTPLDDRGDGTPAPDDPGDGIDGFGVEGEVVFDEAPAPPDPAPQTPAPQIPEAPDGGFGTGTGGAVDGGEAADTGFGGGRQEPAVPRPRDEERGDRDDSSGGRSSRAADEDAGTAHGSSSGEDNGEHGHGGDHHGGGDSGDSGGHDSGGHDSGSHESAGLEHAG
jgi:hypothetical protein